MPEKYRCKYQLKIRGIVGDEIEIAVGEVFDFDFHLANGVSLEDENKRFYVEQKVFDTCFEKVEQ